VKHFLFLLILIISLSAAIPSIAGFTNFAADSSMVLIDSQSSKAQGDSLSQKAVADTIAVVSNFVYPIPPERKEMLISYSKLNNRWRFIDFFVTVGILLVALYTGPSARFRNWAKEIAKKEFLAILLYFVFLLLFLFVLDFPFDYYRNFVIEHKYGFSNQTFGAWFGENLKSMAVTFVFVLPVLWILYWLINRFKKWWLYFAIGAIPFMIFVILIVPVVVAPLFNKFEPVKDQTVAKEMIALAEKAGIHNPDIFEVDASKQSNKINAYFTGLFGTKRIVLYDTIIKNFSIAELKFVMGHEMKHFLKNHIWYGLFIALIMIFIAGYLIDIILPGLITKYAHRLGFSGLGDIAGLPLLILFVTIFGFIIQPVNNGVSRYFEYQADKYGLELSGVTGDEAAVAFDKLSVFNLSDPEPPAIIEFWFYDHPSLKKRMDNIRRLYAQSHGGV